MLEEKISCQKQIKNAMKRGICYFKKGMYEPEGEENRAIQIQRVKRYLNTRSANLETCLNQKRNILPNQRKEVIKFCLNSKVEFLSSLLTFKASWFPKSEKEMLMSHPALRAKVLTQ